MQSSRPSPSRGFGSVFFPQSSIYSALDDPGSPLPSSAVEDEHSYPFTRSTADSRSPFSAEPVEPAQVHRSPQHKPRRSLLGLLSPGRQPIEGYELFHADPVPEEDEDALHALDEPGRSKGKRVETDDDDELGGPSRSMCVIQITCGRRRELTRMVSNRMIEAARPRETARPHPSRSMDPGPSSPPERPHAHFPVTLPAPHRSPSSSPYSSPPESFTRDKEPILPGPGSPGPGGRGLHLGSARSWANWMRARDGRRSGLDARERALWRWVNVEDLDAFLQEVISTWTLSIPNSLSDKYTPGLYVLCRERDLVYCFVSAARSSVIDAALCFSLRWPG